jgi:hypothetical protein
MLPNSQTMMSKRARRITLPIKTARYGLMEARAPSNAVATQVSDALASSTLSWSPTSIPPYLGIAVPHRC